MFGSPRIRRLVTEHTSDTSSLTAYLMEELGRFTGEQWEQEDDVTLVTLQRLAARAKAWATEQEVYVVLTRWCAQTVQGKQALQGFSSRWSGLPVLVLCSMTLLRHSSVPITLDTYSHVIPGLGDTAALAMEDALKQ
jgi:hypothetical protein